MPLVAEGWDVVWREHWPLSYCARQNEGTHAMVQTSSIWQCEECGVWFEEDDLPAVYAAVGRANWLLSDRHRRN